MKTIKLTTPMLLIIGLLLIAGTVTAHGKINHLTAMHENIDPEMKVEEWMVSEMAWVKSNLADIRLEAETLMALEPWMTSDFVWNYGSHATDADLKIEPWMAADNRWDPAKCKGTTDKDPSLSVEQWMTSSDNWR